VVTAWEVSHTSVFTWTAQPGLPIRYTQEQPLSLTFTPRQEPRYGEPGEPTTVIIRRTDETDSAERFENLSLRGVGHTRNHLRYNLLGRISLALERARLLPGLSLAAVAREAATDLQPPGPAGGAS
jgi:hypothetical protein